MGDLVLTPGGFRPSSFVHRVEENHVLEHAQGLFRLKDRYTGVSRDVAGVEAGDRQVTARVESFVMARKRALETPPQEVTRPAVAALAAPLGRVPTLGTGWITYAWWNNGTGHPLSSFRTTWQVPSEPSSNSNQTIFLFNGIQNSGANFGILQPVLQWGGSAAGGGAYWSIASWYVTSGGQAFHTGLVRVNAGDSLVGVMTLTGHAGAAFSYTSEFQGIAGTSLPVQNIAELQWCNETLEAYGVASSSDYPMTRDTQLHAIAIQTGGSTPALSWTSVNAVTDVGQHAVVVNNSATQGEVDLFFRPALGQISAVSWAANRLDIFGLGTDHGMFHKAWSGVWSPSVTGWEALGGVFKSPPAAIAWGPNRLDILGLGTDNGMYHKAWNGAWSPSGTGWEALGGVFDSPPVVISWAPNRLDVFGLGTDNAMYHRAWDGSAWSSGWQNLGGVFNSPPAAVAWGPNRLDLFGLGTDNSMYHRYWNGSAWSGGWENLGGVFTSPPTAVAWGPNRLDLFGLGTDNGMYHRYWNGSAWSGGWENLGGIFNSPPAAVAWGQNRLDLFGLGTDNGMYHRYWNGSSWSGGWENLGGVFDSAPAVVSWAPNRLDIFGLGTNDSMFHKAWDGAWLPSVTGWEPLGGIFR